ncbi:telomere length regulation protein TEL2 homolog [Lepisosteus oculatus]|uniref:telomere length regulation protein TEL2 homolog n=1 Tax=Lepisosteus oculatus TaxID=7918 RepID=UPI0035F5035A
MEPHGPDLEVRLGVRRCVAALSSSGDLNEVTQSLRTLGGFLGEGGDGDQPPPGQRGEFARAHYTRVLQCLIGHAGASWLELLPPAQRAELWDGLFLRGPPDQALLVLLDSLSSSSPSAGLDRVLDVLKQFLCAGRLNALLWSRCHGVPPPESPQLREALLGRLVSLPDIAANRLQHQNCADFLPASYYPLLAREVGTVLEQICVALRGGQDCSLTFVAQLLGKACMQGHSELMFAELVPRLSALTQSDMVWQRVCWRLVESVPERWVEGVVTGLVQAVDGPAALSRILGNVVVKNKKAQFVITHKLLLLQYKYKTPVLRSIAGYLAQDRERRPLLIQALRALLEAWCSGSAVRHSPLEQQLYLSRALLLCAAQLTEAELRDLRAEILQRMMSGMQCHLDSSVSRVRRLGMVVGECLSARLDPEGTQLKFQYDHDAETQELVSLMSPLPASESLSEDTPAADRTELPLNSSESPDRGQKSTTQPDSHQISMGTEQTTDKGDDSELDSDDELTPYDMSKDQKLSEAPPPRYLRDCLEALTTSGDPGKVEASLQAAEGLIRRNAAAAREVSVQLTKVLLHLEDSYNTAGFLGLRQGAMVALAVTDPIPVAEFLTTEFFALNYSLCHRMDILEVLVRSAQELSQPITAQQPPSLRIQPVATAVTSDPHGPALPWRQVVDQRIESKTRRFSKGARRPAGSAPPSRFAPVAGHFFFPLLRNYDRPQVTFDLLGSDHLLLGRLVHTLGLLMHLAANAPVATQMGRALLDFVWAVRYHVDQVVRRGVLFAVCAVFLSMPSQHLLAELSEHLLETRAWLTDVAEGDPDDECRSLAMQSLLLLERSLKKELEPEPLALRP